MCQSRLTIFRRILICVIFRPRDMQEYIFYVQFSSYDVTLFMCQSRLTIFRRILICVIFRPRDMQEYIFYVQYCIRMEIIVLYLLKLWNDDRHQ
jgi:hypothetical protein